MNGAKSTSSRNYASTGVKFAGATRSHPTMRLSHIQHNCSSAPNMAPTASEKCSSEKSKYHEAISRNTQHRFDQELSKAFMYPMLPFPMSRDALSKHQPRPSLAATHPFNYGSRAKSMNMPTPPESVTVERRASSPSVQSQFSLVPQPGQGPIDSPYTDPMHQTSTVPNYWSRSRTVLKADTNIEDGNVISPTFMLGLFARTVDWLRVSLIVFSRSPDGLNGRSCELLWCS
jgi:hypothetical protein